MGYAETRMLNRVQQLERSLQKAKARERQTRQACLDIANALLEIMASAAGTNTPVPASATELARGAGLLLAPDAE